MDRPIILDKSYLEGAKTSDIRALCDTRDVLMPDVLFYEMMSNERRRSRCFAKLPSRVNPMVLVDGIGKLLRYEIDNLRAAGRPSQHPVIDQYRYHPGLGDNSFQLPSSAQKALIDAAARLSGSVDSMTGLSSSMHRMFPSLLKGRDDQKKGVKAEIETLIANDADAIRNFYRSFAAPQGERPFPPAELIDRNWTTFRWLQVKLLFALDIFWRYERQTSDFSNQRIREKIEHDVLDMDYLSAGF